MSQLACSFLRIFFECLSSRAHFLGKGRAREGERRTGVLAYRRTGVPAYRRTGVPAYRRTGVQAYRRTGLPDFLRMVWLAC